MRSPRRPPTPHRMLKPRAACRCWRRREFLFSIAALACRRLKTPIQIPTHCGCPRLVHHEHARLVYCDVARRGADPACCLGVYDRSSDAQEGPRVSEQTLRNRSCFTWFFQFWTRLTARTLRRRRSSLRQCSRSTRRSRPRMMQRGRWCKPLRRRRRVWRGGLVRSSAVMKSESAERRY